MSKTVVTLTSLRPNGAKALESYLSVVLPLMERAGAKVISRHETMTVLAGDHAPQYISIVEFPSDLAIQQVFDSPDYLNLADMREAAFDRYEICVTTPVAI
jgi:uncharacterized protein (DUF1330 family)